MCGFVFVLVWESVGASEYALTAHIYIYTHTHIFCTYIYTYYKATSIHHMQIQIKHPHTKQRLWNPLSKSCSWNGARTSPVDTNIESTWTRKNPLDILGNPRFTWNPFVLCFVSKIPGLFQSKQGTFGFQVPKHLLILVIP